MRQRLKQLCLIVAFVCLVSSIVAGQQDVADVEAVLVRWADAFSAIDGERSAMLYAPDARLWGTIATEQAVGRGPIRDYFDSGRKRARTRRVTFGVRGTRIYGDTAVSSGHYQFDSILIDGTASIRRARFSMVFVKQQGRWLIVDHHSSDVPVAP